MPANTREPLTIFTGQRAQIRAVSLGHGAIRPNMVDAVDFTPALSSTRIPEFDNLVDALTFQTFDGGAGKFGFKYSNQGQIEALVMDQDPSVATFYVNPSLFKPFTLFANLKGLDGKIKGSYLGDRCKAMGMPFTSTVKEAAAGSVDFEFINFFQFRGLGILYTRARSAVAPQGAPAQPTIVGQSTGGNLEDGVYYVRITSTSATGESTASNEAIVEVSGGGGSGSVDVTLPAFSSPITGYNVYVSAESNNERFNSSFTTGAGGTETVTDMPAVTANAVPTTDTTGAFQAPNDKEFVANKVTLDQAAFPLPQSGLDYALILKNGVVVASPDNPATNGDFIINAAGTEFEIKDTPADDEVWDIFTLFQPN